MTWGPGKKRTGTAAWKTTRLRILKRDRWACQWRDSRFLPICGARATDVDHIVAEANGGTDDDTNLQSLCPDHHKRKTALERRLRQMRPCGP